MLEQYISKNWKNTNTTEELFKAILKKVKKEYPNRKWTDDDIGFLVVTNTKNRIYDSIYKAQDSFLESVKLGDDVSMYIMCRFGTKIKPQWREFWRNGASESLYWHSNFF